MSQPTTEQLQNFREKVANMSTQDIQQKLQTGCALRWKENEFKAELHRRETTNMDDDHHEGNIGKGIKIALAITVLAVLIILAVAGAKHYGLF